MIDYKLITRKRNAWVKLVIETFFSAFPVWIYFQVGMDVDHHLVLSAGLFSVYFMCLSRVVFFGFTIFSNLHICRFLFLLRAQ